nr:substrate-binding domain-containing protein [Olsenella profusa]
MRIGVSSGLEAQLLVSTLRRLHQDDPALDPVLRLGPYSAIDGMLERGSVDVVLAYRNPEGEHAGATAFRRLLDAGVACVCSSDHPLAGHAGTGVEGEELLAAGRIAVANPHAAPAAITQAQRSIGLRMNEQQVMMCANVEVALALARAGIAFTLMPDIPALHQDGLSFVPVRGARPIALGVRVRRGRQRTLVDRFIEALGEELAREP